MITKMQYKTLCILTLLLTEDKETFRTAYAGATDNKHQKAGGDVWYYMYEQAKKNKEWREKNRGKK